MLVLFEFIPTGIIIDWIKSKIGIKSTKDNVKSIEDNAQTDVDIFKDGTIILTGIATLLIIVVILIVSRCNTFIYKDYRVFKIYMTIKGKIFHNSIIRYFYTGAIKLQMTSCDIFMAGFTLTLSNCSQWFVAIMIVVALYGSYFRFFFYMRDNREDLPKPSMRKRIGTLYEPFDVYSRLKEPNKIEFYSLVFHLRRTLFVASTFILLHYTGI